MPLRNINLELGGLDMVELDALRKWFEELSKNENISTEDIELYAEEYNIPGDIIAYSLNKEIKHRAAIEANQSLDLKFRMKSRSMEELRVRSGKYVSNATKLYNQGKEVTDKETERADQAELELANVRKQLEFTREILNKNRGSVSEIEIFLSTLDAKTHKSLARAVQKSLHPDKHKGVGVATKRALNEMFRIVNSLFTQD